MPDISELIEKAERAYVETIAADYDFEELKRINRDSDGTSLNPRLEPFIDWSAALLRRIPKNWEDYLVQTPSDLKSLFDETTKLLKQIEKGASQAVGARSAHLNAMSNNIQNVMSRQINSVASLLLLQMIGDDRNSTTGQLRERFEKAVAEADKKLAAATASAQELQEMVDASKEATAKVAASGRAKVFHIEGRGYEDAARNWLIATGFLGGVLLILAFMFALGLFLPIESTAKPAEIASSLFGKALILFTLGAGVTFGARQYSANRHNAVQNLHRSSALRTYRAMLRASRDEAVQEAILQQAAHAIFAPSETGYSKHGTASDQTPMVQLVQGMVKEPPPNG